jgi:serine/threonine protein kinase
MYSSCDRSHLLIVNWKTNILINDREEACLSDFGLSRVLECSGFTTGPGGSARWMAPELIITGYVSEAPRVTNETDVWAFAMATLEVCFQPTYEPHFP